MDDLDNCNFIAPAITRSGPLQVAVSTSGTSPALAKQIRDRIARELITEDVATLADFLGSWRARVKEAVPTYQQRQQFWESVLESHLPVLLATSDASHADVFMGQFLEGFASQAAAPVEIVANPVSVEVSIRPNPPKCGCVILVGAGPGDPELITLKGMRALDRADVVLYDRLAHPDLLAHIPNDAERIYVGKTSGAGGTSKQQEINELLIHHARLGKNVVRLKGGDPFVFGRGAEEMLALHEAGIATEVIPGISSAIAVPEVALIPLTHRGVSAAFGVFSAHLADDDTVGSIDWQAAAQMPTAVFMMGVESLTRIVDQLVKHGRALATPVAVIENGTLANQRVIISTLAGIVADAADVQPPAIIMVGDVVSLRAMLAD